MFNQVLEAIGLARNEEENEQDQALEQAYDDFQRPPKLEIALKHAAATKFAMIDANIDLDNTNVCPCCGQPTVIQELPLCSSRKDFSFNGPGIALYFDFLVFSSIILAVYCLVSAGYGIYDNYYNGNRCDYEVHNPIAVCKQDFYNILSRSNVKKELDLVGSILNCVSVVIIMVITLFYRNHIKTIVQELDDAAILASDYSIFVENIPREAKEIEIRKYFSQNFMGHEVEIRKVCLGYEIQHYLDLEYAKLALQNKITMILELEAAGKKVPASFNKDELQRKAKQLNDEQDDLEDHLDTSFNFSGIAVISYNREKQADWVCEEHKATRFQLLLAEFGIQSNYRKFNNNMLVVQKAPEPGDIIWGNLGITVLQQSKRILITNAMTVFILLIAFLMIFGLSYAQFYIDNQMDENQSSTSAIVNFLGIVASLFITVVNIVLNKLIIKFAEMEKHSTKTNYDISVAKKLGIAQFLNTAILSLLVNFLIKEPGETLVTTMWKPGGLNADVMLIFITNSILPWAMQILDPGYLYKVYVRNKIIKEGNRCKYSQREANLAFEGPQIDLSSKYAILTKTLMMAFFYAYLLPFGVVLTFFSLIFLYWTEKFLLVKRDAKPPPTGSAMAEAMIEFYIELVFIVYAAGCCIWEYLIFDELHWVTWLQLGLSAFYYFMPEERIFGCIIETGRDNATVESYDEKYITFPDDYDRRNPVTLDKAKEAWMKLQQETVTVPATNAPPSNQIQQKKPTHKPSSSGKLSNPSQENVKRLSTPRLQIQI